MAEWGSQPSEPVPLTTTQTPIIFSFHLLVSSLKCISKILKGHSAQEKCEKAVHHLPLGKANTLMIRKKKITERIPLQMLSSGTESSLKIEKEQ